MSANKYTTEVAGDGLPAWRRRLRHLLARTVFRAILFAYLRPAVSGLERFPDRPYVLCFNHLSWVDPMLVMAMLPARPRIYVYGPKEEDLRVGGRNRAILWVATAVPFNPAKSNLLESTRRATAVLRAGYPLAIAGEGGLSEHDGVVLPLHEGAAYFALRASVPVVPVGIVGTRWLRLEKRVEVRIGESVQPAIPAGGSWSCRGAHGRAARHAHSVGCRRARRAGPGSAGPIRHGRIHASQPVRAATRCDNPASLTVHAGGAVEATALSADPDEYRRRLDEQPDDQIDRWAAELMRDLSIRRGVGSVLEHFRRAAGVDERELERVFASGGGAPATVGRTADGTLLLPAISLHYLVAGIRRETPDGRERLTRYLVNSFHEIVYI